MEYWEPRPRCPAIGRCGLCLVVGTVADSIDREGTMRARS